MPEIRVPVLIVGGSLVGLTTAALLSSHGVKTMLVERHRGTAIHPRAASFHQKTMEVFRSLGIQQEVEAAAAREFVQNGAIMACESLAGKELAYFQKNYNEGVEHLSPTPRIFLTQIGLEPILRGYAEKRGADVRFGTELVSFTQTAGEVRAEIRPRDGGETTTVIADYLIGADGAHSHVRESLGIGLAGRGDFAQCITIYFKADVKPMLGDRNLSVIYVNHPDFLGFFRFAIGGDAGFLAVFSTATADGGRDTDVSRDITDEKCVEFVRKALGGPDDLPVEIDSVQKWEASAGWAQSFRSGRVFLAGDAAHTMPPTGGFGGNTGVADAYHLAWRLAAVLSGTAGPALLDSYDAERRPNAALIAEQAYMRYVARLDPTLPKERLAKILDDAAIELGAVCESGAVAEDAGMTAQPAPAGTAVDAAADEADPVAEAGAAADETPAPTTHNPRTGRLRVGARAPHVWLETGGGRISTLDLAPGSFLLIAGPDGDAWCEAAAAIDSPRVTAVRIGADVTAGSDFDEVYGLGRSGAVLIRPDDIVAYRSADGAAAAAEVLSGVLTGILGAPVRTHHTTKEMA